MEAMSLCDIYQPGRDCDKCEICDACGGKNDMSNNYCRDCFVPFEKMSKKEKTARNKAKRVEWGFSPVTRTKPSGKIYNRKKVNREWK